MSYMGTRILFDFLISLIKCANEEFSTELTGTSTCSRKKAPRCKMGPFFGKVPAQAMHTGIITGVRSMGVVCKFSSSVENEMSQISPLTLKR